MNTTMDVFRQLKREVEAKRHEERRKRLIRADRRTRRALLHLSYSYAPPFGPAILVTQDPQETFGTANISIKPKVGARCTSSARRDLHRGRSNPLPYRDHLKILVTCSNGLLLRPSNFDH